MSLERIFNALQILGLSKSEARVYIFIATKGPIAAHNLKKQLKMKKGLISQSLVNLLRKEILFVKKKPQIEISALPFEEVLNLLMENKEERVQNLQKDKEKIIASWQTIRHSKNNALPQKRTWDFNYLLQCLNLKSNTFAYKVLNIDSRGYKGGRFFA